MESHLLEDECLSCHSSSGASGGLNLQDDAYGALPVVISALDSSQILVVPNDSANSLLYTMMAGTPPNGLSPMPRWKHQLDLCGSGSFLIDSGADPCGCDTGSGMTDSGTSDGGEQ